MDRETLVYVDLDAPCLVGRLWSRVRKERESATFEYDRAWLQHPERFALEPALILDAGPQYTMPGKALFGALGDSAPDRWGRTLMRRAERRRARLEHATPRTLFEIDYLLMVDDEARQGALRFAAPPEGAFLAAGDAMRIPPFLELPRLLSASERVLEETADDEDLLLLLAPGSSLGGARPKASVRDRDGRLAIAKFPQKSDGTDVELWEALALSLAGKAGIEVPEWRIEPVSGKTVLLLRRFDRDGPRRISFLSAMSMLGAQENQTRSYLEMADALRRYGSRTVADMRQLWRRIVFNILISNTDDHLRNHGFLYDRARGWRLAPAYDLNPVPVDLKPRILSTAITLDDATASLALALEVAEDFDLTPAQARKIAGEIGAAVSRWRSEAACLGLTARAIERMESAFEHRDLEDAVRGQSTPQSLRRS
jgi:serine/threonine-protein kinase HipA